MRIVCSNCGQALNLPEPVKAKKFRCPKCKTVGQVGEPAAAVESISATNVTTSAPPKPVARPVAPAPAAPPPQQAETWYVQTEDGQQYGPISKADLDNWVAELRISAGCQVLRDGDPQWQWAEDVYPKLKQSPAAGTHSATPHSSASPSPASEDDGFLVNTDDSPVSTNPYASPRISTSRPAKSLSQGKAGPLRTASAGTRFANFFIDNIILQVLSFGVGFAVGTAYVVSNGGVVQPQDVSSLNLIVLLVNLLVVVAYYVFTEALFQRSLAKFITGTKVVNVNGQRASFGQILGRTLARFIPFEAFSFFGNPSVGWHDSLSGTRVISSR